MGIYKFDALSRCHEAPCQLNIIKPTLQGAVIDGWSRYRCVFTSRRKILRSLQRSMLHFCQKGNSKLLSKGVSPPTKNNIHSIYCMNHSRFSSILLHTLSLKHHQTLSSSYGKVHFSILSCLGALGYTAIVLHEVSVLDASWLMKWSSNKNSKIFWEITSRMTISPTWNTPE